MKSYYIHSVPKKGPTVSWP